MKGCKLFFKTFSNECCATTLCRPGKNKKRKKGNHLVQTSHRPFTVLEVPFPFQRFKLNILVHLGVRFVRNFGWVHSVLLSSVFRHT